MKRIILILLSVFSFVYSHSQCTIKTSAEACINTPHSLFIQFSGINDSIVWDVDGTQHLCSPVTHVFTALGVKNITVKLYRKDTLYCTSQTTVNVNPLPVANFTINSPLVQCYRGNSFVFKNTSTHPLGTSIVAKTFYFGDSTAQTITNTDSIIKNYLYKPGKKFSVSLTVEDAKGCFVTKMVDSALEVYTDIGPAFTAPFVKGCKQTAQTYKNTSAIKFSQVNSFRWEMGDNAGINTTNWDTAKYTYTKDTCFAPKLIIENKNGCRDSFSLQAGCNNAYKPVIKINNSGEMATYGKGRLDFVTDFVSKATYDWNFDDGGSGLNNYSKFLSASHAFSTVGPFRVKLSVKIENCTFDTTRLIHIKGPLSQIESRFFGYISPAQRYQCSITDTVFFTNLSQYYLNDKDPLNDIHYNTQGLVLYFEHPGKLIVTDTVKYDTIHISHHQPVNVTLKGGKKVYVSKGGDTVKVVNTTLLFNKYQLLNPSAATIKRSENNCKPEHADRLWNFDDMFAPQCTTDSRPIYPKLPQYNNMHFSGSQAPKNTTDSAGKWINCNFSYDSLPKHFYTAGKERNYRVKLYLSDTSEKDSSIILLTSSRHDPSYPDSLSKHFDSVPLALTPPNASGLKFSGIACYGPTSAYGFFIDFTNTQPNYDREFFWIHLDSLSDRNDATPNTFDKWIPQSGGSGLNPPVVDRLYTPLPLATAGAPPNVDRIFWQYQPNGIYPSKIADPQGWVTVGYRVQNGMDPVTNQPCIDEKWYHKVYKYPPYNSPVFDTTITGGCAKTVTVKFQNPVQDSLKSVTITWGDNAYHTDTFFRDVPEPFTTNKINYRKRYYRNNTSLTLIDSIVTRRINAAGQVVFADYRDSTIEDRQHTYTTYGLYSIGSHIENRLECIMTSFKQIIIGHSSQVVNHVGGICAGDSAQFFDYARYGTYNALSNPPFLDTFDYWRDPKKYPDGSFRPKPKNGQYETLRWDFGKGLGWESNVKDNPVVTYTSPGVYLVWLEYTDSNGCKSTWGREVKVTPAVTGFAVNDSLQCLDNNRFIFTSPFSSNDSVAINWKFSNLIVSKKLTDTITFTNPGSYKAILEATNKAGCLAKTERFVYVLPKLKPSFTVDSISRCGTSRAFNFKVASIDTPGLKYKWDFGDGLTSTQTQVGHAYSAPGNYPVKLTWDYNECADSAYTCINVYPLPNAAFDTIALTNPGQYKFTPADTLQALYDWDFGDGNTSGSKYPVHTYASTGNYIINLTVTSSHGCKNSAQDTIAYATTGVDEFANESQYVRVSPNPFRNKIEIHFKNNLNTPSKVTLYDLTGRIISEYLVDGNTAQKEIDTEGIPAGVYIIRVSSENEELGVFKINKID